MAGTSAGGGYTTAADLMRFAEALMSNKLLKAETLAEATRPQFTTGDYGFGFQIGRPNEARTYGHGGGAPGMNAILRVYPESGQSVIVLCNLDRPSASRIGDWLHARMPLKEFPKGEKRLCKNFFWPQLRGDGGAIFPARRQPIPWGLRQRKLFRKFLIKINA